jgi:hypothetical protein
MKYLIKKNKYSRYILTLLLLVLMVSITEAKLRPPNRAKQLQEQGYSTDTPEQIIEATKSENYFVRFIALELLVERTKENAIPTLKEALSDPRIEVRWRAAHLLGTLGDKSGLEQMQQDLMEFAPNNGAPVSHDPNVTDPNEIKEQEDKRNLRLYYALRAAKVLAELDDRRGYELAVRMALGGAWEAQRQEAIHVLVEIAKVDESILETEGKAPASVLCAMAASEKDERVIYLLTNQVRQNLSNDIAIQILEITKNSPNLSKKAHRVVQMHLDAVKAKKAAEN